MQRTAIVQLRVVAYPLATSLIVIEDCLVCDQSFERVWFVFRGVCPRNVCVGRRYAAQERLASVCTLDPGIVLVGVGRLFKIVGGLIA